jgi:hypothetical protein
MALGVHGDSRDLAEVHVRRQFQKIGHGIVSDLRRRLRERSASDKYSSKNTQASLPNRME